MTDVEAAAWFLLALMLLGALTIVYLLARLVGLIFGRRRRRRAPTAGLGHDYERLVLAAGRRRRRRGH